MAEDTLNKQHKSSRPSNNPKPKRPPLTHFLCLPLINSVSLPQLESSLATFKASIPSTISPTPDEGQQGDQRQPHRPLIPEDAIRPVGTLHLTLGVMSLPTPERLDEALRLFHSLDLVALLCKAQENASRKRPHTWPGKRDPLPQESKQNAKQEIGSAPDTVLLTRETLEPALSNEPFHGEPRTPQPFNISLESMHVLPRARAATVLHATPVDPTSRLYPFCEALRDKFLEAGFLQGEYRDDPNQKQKKQKTGAQNKDQTQPAQDHPDPGPSTSANHKTEVKLKPRRLLLHATIVNTIYIKGRRRNTRGGQDKQKKNTRPERYTFDARDILSHYMNFYLDSARTIPRSGGGVIGQSQSHADLETVRGISREDIQTEEYSEAGVQKGNEETQPASDNGENSGYPFVWAKNIPIEGVCICEMGAKKLVPAADESGMNARLGEKYTVVAERSLDVQAIDGQGIAGGSESGVGVAA
ncbi:uncharacterized protein DSM5745_04639 [Aspergillus mulundensis]|uniref:A-kinase anchor protein 7-like phosphoesterase domain-containing protein n=1 Tax=Aspergillus mulundensis TaxID=1810919 RepID=A0A3D8S455_9EURO|nr:Uncharacterized protein DSM5745_04639 [Aspergillus mulundensis]RDW81082.1 Uncharacterized protein DSM5745_04639 [Aspergillus mulundensis]